MPAIPPKTSVEGLKRAVLEIIDGAFTRGRKQGHYEQQQAYAATKETQVRIREERDALLADLTLVCADVPNPCPVCGHWRDDWEKPGCELSGLTCAWYWRGLQKGGPQCQMNVCAASSSHAEKPEMR